MGGLGCFHVIRLDLYKGKEFIKKFTKAVSSTGVREIVAMWVSSQIITGSMITGIYSHEDDSSVDLLKKSP